MEGRFACGRMVSSILPQAKLMLYRVTHLM